MTTLVNGFTVTRTSGQNKSWKGQSGMPTDWWDGEGIPDNDGVWRVVGYEPSWELELGEDASARRTDLLLLLVQKGKPPVWHPQSLCTVVEIEA